MFRGNWESKFKVERLQVIGMKLCWVEFLPTEAGSMITGTAFVLELKFCNDNNGQVFPSVSASPSICLLPQKQLYLYGSIVWSVKMLRLGTPYWFRMGPKNTRPEKHNGAPMTKNGPGPFESKSVASFCWLQIFCQYKKSYVFPFSLSCLGSESPCQCSMRSQWEHRKGSCFLSRNGCEGRVSSKVLPGTYWESREEEFLGKFWWVDGWCWIGYNTKKTCFGHVFQGNISNLEGVFTIQDHTLEYIV